MGGREARGRGRSPTGFVAVAARRLDGDEARCRAPAPRSRSRRRRRSARPAAGPSAPRSPVAQRVRQRRRTTRGSRATGSRSGACASCASVRNSGSWPPAAISAWMSASPSREVALDVDAGVVQRVEQRRSRWPACRARPPCRPARAWSGSDVSTIADALLGRGQRRAAARGDREPREPGAALGVGDVGARAAERRVVGVALLEGDRHADDAPVELGDRDLHGGVERASGPRRDSSQRCARVVAHSAWMTGTSSASSASASHSSAARASRRWRAWS